MQSVKTIYFIEMMALKNLCGEVQQDQVIHHFWKCVPLWAGCFQYRLGSDVPVHQGEVIQSYEYHGQTRFSVLPGRQGTHFYLVKQRTRSDCSTCRTGLLAAAVTTYVSYLIIMFHVCFTCCHFAPPALRILPCVVDPVLYRSCSRRHLPAW